MQVASLHYFLGERRVEHKLRVLVRFNIDLNCASVEVRGCLTYHGCDALLPIIRRARHLSGGMPVVVNLRKARHIEEDALSYLQELCADDFRKVVADEVSGDRFNRDDRAHRPDDTVTIEIPGMLPLCPALKVLHNADAARLAFLQRNPSVLGAMGLRGLEPAAASMVP